MAVKRWIGEFLKRHRARYDPKDWPNEAGEWAVYLRLWIGALAAAEATEELADAGSELLVASPPKFRLEHIPAVLTAIAHIRAERAGTEPEPGSRQEAEKRSHRCPECEGGGMTFRRFLTSYGSPCTLGFACLCPLGMWLAKGIGQGGEVSSCASLNLADYPDLWNPTETFPGWPTKPTRQKILTRVRTSRGTEVILDRPLLPWLGTPEALAS